MTYGVDLRDSFRRAAGYVDRIVKGAEPEDLARKLGVFVQDPQQALAFRRRIRPVRTIAAAANQLEALYGELLARRGARAGVTGRGRT